METNFWLERWRNNEIGFHQNEVNPFLTRYFKELLLDEGARVFVPLCGKTFDIAWLLSEGYRVVGVELAESAVKQLFAGLAMEPQILQEGKFKLYRSEMIDVFAGDLFNLTGEMLGSVDGVYDRAALVALPEEMRVRYTKHLTQLTDRAPQLLITYVYDQNKMPGPPFSVTPEEVTRHYADSYRIKRLEKMELPGGLKGKCAATEMVWFLANKQKG
jgi:thiopurine S-methyltransferase